MAPLPAISESSTRFGQWLKDNKAILLSLAAAGVVGGGAATYYYYNYVAADAAAQRAAAAHAAEKRRSKSGKHRSKRASSQRSEAGQSDNTDGQTSTTSSRATEGPSVTDGKPLPIVARIRSEVPESLETLSPALTASELNDLSTPERSELAQVYKSHGNKAYLSSKNELALELYTRAINSAPEPEAVFFSNRAACYNNMKKYELSIKDCDAALKLDEGYIKALNRRATAKEELDDLRGALLDFTASTIFEGVCSNNPASDGIQRILQKYGNRQAEEVMNERGPQLPSISFIRAYMNAFHVPLPTIAVGRKTSGDEQLLLGFEALKAENYTHAFTLVNEALESDNLSTELKPDALGCRATFKFLIGDTPGSLEDFNQAVALDPKHILSHVQMASVHMERGRPDEAFKSFDKAIAIDAKHSDTFEVYYHRGQVHFVLGNFADAIKDYEHSIRLNPDYVFSHVQLAVTQYKLGKVPTAMAIFKKAGEQFENSSEVRVYFGELLLDSGSFKCAQTQFDEAMKIEKEKSHPNVLAWVNKALLVSQWKQAISQAESLCQEAVSLDPRADQAMHTLAQLQLQQVKMKEATESFKKHAYMVRTQPEMANAFTFYFMSLVQLDFMEKYPHQIARLHAVGESL